RIAGGGSRVADRGRRIAGGGRRIVGGGSWAAAGAIRGRRRAPYAGGGGRHTRAAAIVQAGLCGSRSWRIAV
ncbi:hypothetical protein, partial [Paractinoplanes durhamensis]|uniref:hypothetical protein n=1 Tax=Paractinoplanes durhamensis TaxID=113563 RepID=UPI0031D6528B